MIIKSNALYCLFDHAVHVSLDLLKISFRWDISFANSVFISISTYCQFYNDYYISVFDSLQFFSALLIKQLQLNGLYLQLIKFVQRFSLEVSKSESILILSVLCTKFIKKFFFLKKAEGGGGILHLLQWFSNDLIS